VVWTLMQMDSAASLALQAALRRESLPPGSLSLDRISGPDFLNGIVRALGNSGLNNG
jgi:hypothetical protein